ncbi:MAG: family 10 glycosylhydrolase [Planctomycetes bacterium]|nr:family 10 glycosylhydrolase [Planctomycetota bacterium]
MREARKKLAHRKRRIVFNNDGDEAVYSLKKATRESFLAARTTPLLGSQVDSIFYCTWSSGFSFFTHNTKVGQVFDTTVNPKHPANKGVGFANNKTADFIKQGTDPLKMMVEFCKEHNLEVFWSFRMNDTHDAWGSWYGEHLFPQIKKDHPEWLVSELKDKSKRGSTNAKDYNRSKHGGWTAMDFGHKEVRDLAVKFIEEVCQNYDIDGIEMDYFRHPIYFKKPAWGEDAGQEELDKLTDMVRQVRTVTEREALKRGRPILVAVRVPDSVEYCKAMGIDIERWLKEGLVDIMGVSGYFRLNPWEVSVKLGHKYGVPVLAGLSESRIRDKEARKVRASIECYRGRALNAWSAGVDGIYIFNVFNPRRPMWRELGDPKALETMDQVYVVNVRGTKAISRWMRDGEKRFLTRSRLSPEQPITLQPGKAESVRIRVGENPAERKNEVDVTLQLRVRNLPDPAELSVKVNGQSVAGKKSKGVWFDYVLNPEMVKEGFNTIEVLLKDGGTAKSVWQDVLLWVRQKKKN